MHPLRAIIASYGWASRAAGRPRHCGYAGRTGTALHWAAPKPPTLGTSENAAVDATAAAQRRVDVGPAQRCHCQRSDAAVAAERFGSAPGSLAPALANAFVKATRSTTASRSSSSSSLSTVELRTSLALVISGSSSCLFASAHRNPLLSPSSSSAVDKQLFREVFTAHPRVASRPQPLAPCNSHWSYSILAGVRIATASLATSTRFRRSPASSCYDFPLRRLHTGAADMVWVSDFDLDPEVRCVCVCSLCSGRKTDVLFMVT